MARFALWISSLLWLTACQSPSAPVGQEPARTRGTIERLSPKMARYLTDTAAIEVLASGFDWSEGPLWLPRQQMLVFSDVPANTVYRWAEGMTAAEVWLHPSGWTGPDSIAREGSNGLLFDREGRLVLCQHGDRRLARMDAPLDAPAPRFVTLADRYEGKRFNSPNDAALHPDGSIYFTDPPYGLPGQDDDPEKELPFSGVYRLAPDGQVTLLLDSLSRPNGIAFAPDARTCYIANSDPDHAIWLACDVADDGTFEACRVFFDATAHVRAGEPGLPDGLKVHPDGTVWATGPDGVWVFSPEGEVLGRIRTGLPTANCAFDEAHRTLYMTADSLLLRIQLKK